jgi:hypothetical protein
MALQVSASAYHGDKLTYPDSFQSVSSDLLALLPNQVSITLTSELLSDVPNNNEWSSILQH